MSNVTPQNNEPIERVAITKIDIGARRREKVGSIASLKKSIAELGLINPILIRADDNRLVAGERRLRAMLALDWKTVPARRVKVTDAELREIELAENVERSDLYQYEATETRRQEVESLARQLAEQDGRKGDPDPLSYSGRGAGKGLSPHIKVATKRLGISPDMAKVDRKILSAVRQFPTLDWWSRRALNKGVPAIRSMPEAEWREAERFAGTFDEATSGTKSQACTAAADALVALAEWPEELRKKLWKATRSVAGDPEKIALIQQKALGVPPVPDERFGHVRRIRNDLREVLKDRAFKNKTDRVTNNLQQALGHMDKAVLLLEEAYEEVRREFTAI